MSVLDPNWFNNAVLKGDYAPSLKNVANPYQALQGIAGTTPITQGNWRGFASQYDQGHPYTQTTPTSTNSGGVWNQPGTMPGRDVPRPPSILPVPPPPPPVPVGGRGGATGSGLGTSLTPTSGSGNIGSVMPNISGSTGGNGGGGLNSTTPSVSLTPVSGGQNTTQPVDWAKLFNPSSTSGYDGATLAEPGPSIDLGGQGQSGAPGMVDYARLMNPGGYDGTTVGYDATTPQTSSVFPTGPNMAGGGLNPAASGAPDPSSTSTSPFPNSGTTLGQPMYPWLSGYQGQFTAPMSAEQNQGLQGISSFVGGGENLGGAQGYINNVLSGQYLSPSTNPNLQAYINSLSGIHDYQDNLERQRIGSSMAAGGNALSGARASAEEEYQNESNNQYQNQIASLLNSNYQNERGLQNSAVPLQMGLSNEMLGGNQALMQAGGVPQQLSQNDLNAQYGDFLRQISGMQQAYNQPEQQALALLHSGYPGQYQQQYQPSAAASWLGALLGNGSSGSGLLNTLFGTGTANGASGGSSGGLLGALGNLLGLGGGGGSTDTTDPYGYPTGAGTDPSNPWGTSTGQDYGPDSSYLSGGFDSSQIDPYTGQPYYMESGP